MQSLVGYTGFVGSNLAKSHVFEGLYNSRNIEDAYFTNPELLIYAGVKAEKFLANKDAKADFAVIQNAIDNINKINPKKIVLISTIDIYKNPVGVDENSKIDTKNLHPYGLNRYYLEQWVEENLNNYLIVRLPGLFGNYIKKNFIFDMINIIPSMLNKDKYQELSLKSDRIARTYVLQENGFYKCMELVGEERQLLKNEFMEGGFSALNFTDSRGIFQFYNLSYLWEHIQIALKNDIKKLNLAVEPVLVSEIYRAIKGKDFINEVATVIPRYDFKTKHAHDFNGENGYIFTKQKVLGDIINFVKESDI